MIIVINDTPAIVLENEHDFLYKIFYKGQIRIVYYINNILYFDNHIPHYVIGGIKDPIQLEILSKNGSSLCRNEVARNPFASKDTLFKLCDDKIHAVRESALKTIRKKNKNKFFRGF